MRTSRKNRDSRDYVRVEGLVAYVELTNGKMALVDAADANEVGGHIWCCNRNNYVTAWINGGTVPLHRFILKPSSSRQHVDHRDGNPLNNVRANLRACNHSENQHNRKAVTMWAGKPVSSEFKGVSFHRKTGKYTARIMAGGKRHHLGLFSEPGEAAAAYDRAARQFFGPFARTNGKEG
jgi:hypothetical protein